MIGLGSAVVWSLVGIVLAWLGTRGERRSGVWFAAAAVFGPFWWAVDADRRRAHTVAVGERRERAARAATDRLELPLQ